METSTPYHSSPSSSSSSFYDSEYSSSPTHNSFDTVKEEMRTCVTDRQVSNKAGEEEFSEPDERPSFGIGEEEATELLFGSNSEWEDKPILLELIFLLDSLTLFRIDHMLKTCKVLAVKISHAEDLQGLGCQNVHNRQSTPIIILDSDEEEATELLYDNNSEWEAEQPEVDMDWSPLGDAIPPVEVAVSQGEGVWKEVDMECSSLNPESVAEKTTVTVVVLDSDEEESSEHGQSPEGDGTQLGYKVHYDFEADRKPWKFQHHQIWAVNCRFDAMPKNYAQINWIKTFPDFKLSITWLEPYGAPKGVQQWFEKEMPVACGMFRLGKTVVLTQLSDSRMFSHKSEAKVCGIHKYEIIPRKGELWALYKNFDSEMTCSELVEYEYDIVEVIDITDEVTKIEVALVWLTDNSCF
ncbi:hypothetical protein IFM89_014110 [Coptis chinensis]|uniref:DUF3444 domain-containing protein n=1 Tax=Coptis chinensis TaxID=261450 RepID=A0A835HUU6_9MAGN|nr:hypothetical protein IFM89_014110 [Coptis chinensis]